MYGLYGLKVIFTCDNKYIYIGGDVTDAGQQMNEQTREDRAAQPIECWRLGLANKSRGK